MQVRLIQPRLVGNGLVDHESSLRAETPDISLREEPSHEIDGSDGHSDPKDDAGEHAFRLALAKSKHQTANHDRYQRESAGDRAGEGGLQDLDGIVPGIAL